MQLLCKVRPTQEVESLARVYNGAQGVYIVAHVLSGKKRIPADLCPDSLQLCQGIRVGKDTAHEGTPVASRTHLVCPLFMLVARIYVKVIVKCQVIVPYGSGIYQAVGTLLVHKHLPYHVGVSIVFTGQEISEEGVEVKHLAITSLGISIVGCKDTVLHGIEVIADIIELFGLDVVLIGIIYRDRIAMTGSEVDGILRGIPIHLYQITSCDGEGICARIVHLHNVDSLLVQSYVVGKLVTSTVISIQNHIHAAAPGSERHAHPSAHLKSHIVANECFVTIIVDERPLLGLGW